MGQSRDVKNSPIHALVSCIRNLIIEEEEVSLLVAINKERPVMYDTVMALAILTLYVSRIKEDGVLEVDALFKNDPDVNHYDICIGFDNETDSEVYGQFNSAILDGDNVLFGIAFSTWRQFGSHLCVRILASAKAEHVWIANSRFGNLVKYIDWISEYIMSEIIVPIEKYCVCNIRTQKIDEILELCGNDGALFEKVDAMCKYLHKEILEFFDPEPCNESNQGETA